MLVFAQLVLALGLVGHFLISIGAVNRLHALRLHGRWFKVIESPLVVAGIAAPLAAFWQVASGGLQHWIESPGSDSTWATPVLLLYFSITSLVLIVRLPVWLRDRLRPSPAALELDRGRLIDVAARIGGRPTGDAASRLLANFPGNEIFQLDVRDKQLRLPRLPPALDGLTIVHLSDLHFSGRIGIEYFEAVVDETNALRAEIVLATGDFFDKPQCIDWLPRTLARLAAPLGVYFILGNHDWRLPDAGLARQRLSALGWTDLGGRVARVAWRGVPVELAGNELPWFGPAPDWATAPRSSGAALAADGFRIALVHTPDQFPWACRQQADLVLAGHTHGGQVRLPGIGAVFAPSLYGVKYAGGVFQSGATIMHVSRGVSGLEPVRWNCPPEVALLTLRSTAPS